ncbi:uncharacterized protein KY384_002870 [Bacidia gigantensis]|uniref:uncharacterized protein n=1 Tax=Bacidia gigantensis TaxID=2732470 RepID=UPI001D039B0E|nr:uncharacterized protein KY384_002870 [Bacidia gigantensis]KAG8532385.1 hypothetical protein KY384_002870 [Bacidia gigantensis]
MSDPSTPSADEKGFVASEQSLGHGQSYSRPRGEVYDIAGTDPVLSRKMAAVNDAIDEIGLTPYHWKLFCLNGFGYAVDSICGQNADAVLQMLIVLQGITQPMIELEYKNPNKHIKGISLASAIGLLVGALFWGFLADVIGRKVAFNSTLFICAIATILAGAMPNYVSFATFVAIAGFSAGGNYILDSTVFLEFVPSNKAWLVTLLSIWWAIGYTVSGLFAWAFLSNYSCTLAPKGKTQLPCHRADNMGWRYLHWSLGALVFVLSILRLTVLRLQHSAKWLITQGRDSEVLDTLQKIATTYRRPLSLKLEDLLALGEVADARTSVWSPRRLKAHVGQLFQTHKLAYSTSMLFLVWAIIGIAYPLFYVFLPYYLALRGYQAGKSSNYITWRNFAVNQVCGLFGPIIAAWLVQQRFVGRKGTLAIGALLTMAFLFGYTQVTISEQNLGLVCAISVVS